MQVNWALKYVPTDQSPYILDIGAGNGVLSISLAEAGYDPKRITGIDYSDHSIHLARLIATDREHPDITFETGDFLQDDPTTPQGMTAGWDLLFVPDTLSNLYYH